MSIKTWAKNCALIRMLYYGTKYALLQNRKLQTSNFLLTMREKRIWSGKLPYQLQDQYRFDNRQKCKNKLCMILAGYKTELWEYVFERIAAFIPDDVDVCVMTSGIKSPDLIQMCQERGWSYLATRYNKLTRIQNLAIYLHPCAEYIYKLDEDMFITEGFFEQLYDTYQKASQELLYDIAYVAPLIPVNGYGYVRILDQCGLMDDWAQLFGAAVYTDGKHHHNAIVEQGAAARYMWGETQPVLRDLDRLSYRFLSLPNAYSICPIRFSIGAILFTRAAWLDWGMFPVDWTIGLGLDEECLAHYCMFHGKVAVVSENTLAGHFSFGAQTKDMLQYMMQNKEIFKLKR